MNTTCCSALGNFSLNYVLSAEFLNLDVTKKKKVDDLTWTFHYVFFFLKELFLTESMCPFSSTRCNDYQKEPKRSLTAQLRLC